MGDIGVQLHEASVVSSVKPSYMYIYIYIFDKVLEGSQRICLFAVHLNQLANK